MKIDKYKSIPPRMVVTVDKRDIARLIATAAQLAPRTELLRQCQIVDKFLDDEGDQELLIEVVK